MAGCVVAAAGVPEDEASDTARTKLTLGASVGCDQLEQRVVRFAPGRSSPQGPGERRELALFALAGSGTILVDGVPHPLRPETAAYVAVGEHYEIDNPGPDDIEIVSVSSPEPPGPGRAAEPRVTVSLAEQEAHAATTDRLFCYLVHPGMGCRSMTQFVGYIPTAEAPTHYHRYDEVIYVLDGQGVAHIGDIEAPIGAGTCIHLPPGQPHRLQNTGTETMRVLAVFRPAGDPSEAYEV